MRMRKTQLSAFIVAVLVLAACEPTPPTATPLAASASEICGDLDATCVFDGTWTLSIDEASLNCSGSITLTDHLNGFSFEGTWLIETLGDCSQGSPVSGEVQEGRIRDDGGVNFFMEVPPPVGLVKSVDNIWTDIFRGSGVIDLDEFQCAIVDMDNQMNGALSGSALSASATAALSCDEEVLIIGDNVILIEEVARAQIRFNGTR